MNIMFEAFTRAQVKKMTPLVSLVITSMERHAKSMGRRQGKSWTARLSYRTARYLASKGVPLQ